MHGNSRPPRVGVVGCGYWGKNLVRNFHELGALAAVCDDDPVQAKEHATRHETVARPFTDLVADPAIDGIVIASPAVTHARLAREALAAGKDVLVEKPLALRISEALALCKFAEDSGRILMVGHLLRYHAAFIRLCEIVESGELGGIRYIYSSRLNLGKIRREENILWSFAPHDISMILALIGQEPTTVLAVGARYLDAEVADVTNTHLTFAGGERAHVFVSWLHPYKEQKLVVVGDRAMAVFDDGRPWDAKLVVYSHRIEWKNGQPAPSKADGIPVPLQPAEPLTSECQAFLDSLATRQPPITDGREGFRVLRVLDAAERSMTTGRMWGLPMGDTAPRACSSVQAKLHAQVARVDREAVRRAGVEPVDVVARRAH